MPELYDDREIDPRFLAPWPAKVIDCADPLGLHRVRVRVPGLIEPASAWAFPLTAGGGSAQRGGHAVPELGSIVVVQFLGGDPERPVYSGGWWGSPPDGDNMLPTSARDAGTDAHKVQCLQLGRLLITHDERDRDDDAGTGQVFSIEDTVSGDNITIDWDAQGITIKATSVLNLLCDGLINITAAQVQVNERVHQPTSRQA